MTQAALLDDDLHRSLLHLLSAAGGAKGADVASFKNAGLLVGLLGFDGGERATMTADCKAELSQRGFLVCAAPIGSGGLLVTLANLCTQAGPEHGLGCAVVLPTPRHVGAGEPPSIAQQLFTETPGRYIVAIAADRQADARLLCNEYGVPLWPLGRTGGRELVVRASGVEGEFKEVIRVSLNALCAAREHHRQTGI